MNWQEIVIALRQQGQTLVQIARETGLTDTAIYDMSKGKTQDPRFSTGIVLIQYAKECGVDFGRARQ